MAYEKTPLEWQNAGTEPAEDLKASGFLAGMKPAADTFNYFWNNTSECIKELQTTIGDTTNLTTTNKASIVDAVNDGLNTKVDKVEGKGLSTNDYTTEEKEKLASLSGASANVSYYAKSVPINGWEGETAPYTQRIEVEGILATDHAIVDLVIPSVEATEKHLESWGCVSKISSQQDGLLLQCFEEKPTVTLAIWIMVVR